MAPDKIKSSFAGYQLTGILFSEGAVIYCGHRPLKSWGRKMAAANLGEDLIVSIDSVERKDDSAGNSDLRFPSFSEVEQDSWVKVNITESFKVVVLGDSQVGKTSLAHLFSKERALTHSMTTIGFEPFDKHVRTGDRVVKVRVDQQLSECAYLFSRRCAPCMYSILHTQIYIRYINTTSITRLC